MKKLAIILAAAGLMSITACKPVQHHHALRTEEHTVYHFADGRVGYQDANMIWWYLAMSQSNNYASRSIAMSSSSSSFSSAPMTPSSPAPLTGRWTQGKEPTKEELDEAETEQMEVVEDANGAPATPEEVAEEQEATMQATEEGEQASPASEATTESTPTESSSSDSGSSSSDSGGGDSGGGE